MAQRFSSLTSNRPTCRVLIADDVRSVREDLRLLLQLTGQVQVIGEAANGLEAIRLAEQLRPDVVLLDLEMPELDGCAAAREIKARELAARIVMLSIHLSPAEVRRAEQAGADAFVPKGTRLETLLAAILGPQRTTRPIEEDL